MRFLRGAALLVVVLAWSTGLASAARIVPPGNSAASQYAQTLPGPGGEEQVTPQKGHRSDNVTTKGTAAQLDEMGAAGEAALQLTAETAPQSVHHRRHDGAAKHGNEQTKGLAGGGSNGSSGVGEVLKQVAGTESSGGLGVVQPLLILLALLAAGAYVITRRRGRHQGG